MLGKISSYFSRKEVFRPSTPAGRRLYAIGDIHGRLDLLDGLLRRIEQDEEERGKIQGELIFLGDLINRGPRSAQVIDRLIQLKTSRPGTRFVKGNHEELFLASLNDVRGALRTFDRMGGKETMLSYGILLRDYEKADFTELSGLLRSVVPLAHKEFLERFEDIIVEGDYVFVHAGIRPGVPLEKQHHRDLRWIREEFTLAFGKQASIGELGKVIVHGHTIANDVVEHPARIGLDTGAYYSGRLTAMAFEDDKRWLLQEKL